PITGPAGATTLNARQVPDGSDAHLSLHAPGGNRVGQRRVVAFGLVGIALGEVGHGLVELVRPAEVGGDRDPVPGPGVRAGEGPAAHAAVAGHRRGVHAYDLGGVFPVARLAEVVVGRAAARRGGALPAEEDVADGLHQILAGDDTL